MIRLFVPLAGKWYDLFASGEKTWELRGIGNQFNEKQVQIGREVEIRRGYSAKPLFGTIFGIFIVKDYDELPEYVKDGVFPKSIRNDIKTLEFLRAYREKYRERGLIAFNIVNLKKKEDVND